MTATNPTSALEAENKILREALAKIDTLVSTWEGTQGGTGKSGAAFFAALERTPTAQDFRSILDDVSPQDSTQEG